MCAADSYRGINSGGYGGNPTDSASTEEAKPSYMAVDQTDVDPFDDSYLLELLIDSIWLMDDSLQWLIASV
jgi:hypothetical protein